MSEFEVSIALSRAVLGIASDLLWVGSGVLKGCVTWAIAD